jgi:hypothetical protein
MVVYTYANRIHGEVYSIQHYVIKWFAAGRLFSPGTPVSLTQLNWPPLYNWNIVESGAKQHKPSQTYTYAIVLQ